jgi:hypothetical protein
MVRIVAACLVLTSAVLLAGDTAEYVGVNNCKMCHKTEEKGNQFGIWSETKHATALETLMGDEALKIAEERGLEALPSESAECLPCHTTGYGQGGYEVLSTDFVADEANKKAVKKNNALASVSCEVCHGAGKNYKSKKIMTGIFDGSISADSVGLVMPSEETCLGCHNDKSPAFSGFDYEALSAKIAHPYPEGMRE